MEEHDNEVSTSNNEASTPNNEASTSNTLGEVDQDERQSIKTRLLHAALSGKYEEAEEIITKHRDIINAELLSVTKETALHVAAGANQTDFVRKLKERNDVNFRAQDGKGNTAFCTAVAAGASEIVEIFLGMTQHHDYFMETPGGQNSTALYIAAKFGHEKIASRLYGIVEINNNISKFCPGKEEQKDIFFCCIQNDLYELALKMLGNESFACVVENARDSDTDTRETALHLLSRKPPSVFAAPKKNGPFWKISSRSPSQSCEPLETPALELVIELWKRVLKANQYNYSEIKKTINSPFNLVIEAAKVGNCNFLVVLIRCYPELIWVTPEDQTIFHVAIKNRHVEIFRLIHEIGLLKTLLETYECGGDENNLLHLVALKPEENRLRNIVGAALQMRQEILWYKEVEKIVIPSLRNKANSKGETPKDLFSEQHKDLMEKSKTWMKTNAKIGLLVATIIVTVIFQAAFGAPGDDKGNSSSPSANQRKILSVILSISNTLAMSTSSIAIMLFLSILISRFTEKELFLSLPLLFIGGIFSLFVSVTSMMVTFCLATFLDNKSVGIRIFSGICLGFPVLLFPFLVYPIVRDLISSTLCSKRAFKPRERAIRNMDERRGIHDRRRDEHAQIEDLSKLSLEIQK